MFEHFDRECSGKKPDSHQNRIKQKTPSSKKSRANLFPAHRKESKSPFRPILKDRCGFPSGLPEASIPGPKLRMGSFTKRL